MAEGRYIPAFLPVDDLIDLCCYNTKMYRPISRQLSTPIERSASREAALGLGPRGVKLNKENAKRGIVSNNDDKSSVLFGSNFGDQSLPNLDASISTPIMSVTLPTEQTSDPYTNSEPKSQLSDFSELFSPSSEFTFTLSGGMRLQSRDRDGLHSSDSHIRSKNEGKNGSRPGSLERKLDVHQPWRHTTRYDKHTRYIHRE